MEADDGPTLTALRAFRDGYMQRSPGAAGAGAPLLRDRAPDRGTAIPDGSRRLGMDRRNRVDAAVAAIDAGADDRAFGIYVDMVRRLEDRWLEPAAGAAS